MTRRSVALVHDYLTQRGGAERVVLAMHRAFPSAPVYTSLYDPTGTFADFANADVRTSALDRIGVFRRSHRLALPALAPAFSGMHIDADVAICSSSGWAHGADVRGCKVVYCHAPARWLYQTDAYLSGSPLPGRVALAALRPILARWDRRAARSADVYLTNSRYTRELIRRAYGIDAHVVWPPSTVDPDAAQEPVAGLDPGYFLCVSRLLPYKNVDVVLQAFRLLPLERIVVVGRGPAAPALARLAPANATLLPTVGDAELRWLYAHARAVIGPSYEDFGLTPIEAARFGIPTVALRFGGYLDTVLEGETGLFFETPEPFAVAHAVARLPDTIDPSPIRLHALKFSEERFRSSLEAAVDCAGEGSAS